MVIRSCLIALPVVFAIAAATGASAAEVANGLSVNGLSVNGLSVNGLSVNGLSVNGTEKSADLNLKAIVLQNGQIVSVER